MKIFGALAAALLIAAAADAKTLHVPADYLFIQDAIDAAKAGDEVLVAPGRYQETINFHGKAITVRSMNGAEVTTLDGGMTGSVVTFFSEEGEDSVLEGFTIENGSGTEHPPFTFGGGIYCSQSSPTLRSNVVCGNTDIDLGAGIFCFSSSPTIVNTAVVNNAATGSLYGSGGGIAVWYHSAPVITNCTIAGNEAQKEGGGLWGHNAVHPKITNTIFAANTAPTAPEIRLGSEAYPSKLTLSHSLVNAGDMFIHFGCDLLWGDGMIEVEPGLIDLGAGDFRLSSSSPCIDAGDGGVPGLPATDYQGDPRVVDGLEDFDPEVDMGCDEFLPLYVPVHYEKIQRAVSAAVDGDTIRVLPGFYMENLDFLGRNITIRSDQDGDLSTVDIAPASTVISGGGTGSVVTFRSGETRDAVLHGFTVTGGVAVRGGGLYLEESNATVLECVVSGNSADAVGGGICCFSNAAPLVEQCTIEGNHAGQQGGGAFAYQKASPLFLSNMVSANTAGWSGGGIGCHGSAAQLEENQFKDNAAQYGGGVSVQGLPNPLISGNTFSGNSAAVEGGAIRCFDGAEAVIRYNDLHGNTAPLGGGITSFTAAPQITDNRLHANTADYGGGIFCMGEGDAPVLKNNCIVLCEAAQAGGGLCCAQASAPIVENTIMWGNQAPSGPGIHVEGGAPQVAFCNIQGGWTGTGNIAADPLFVNAAAGDFHLTWTSPCINRGTNDKIPKLDMDGDARPHMGTADMGCDEFTDTHALEADKFKLSANAAGGTIEFTLHGKAGNAGRDYFILGSVTGTAPGLPLPGGKAVLPINFDLFTEFVIAHIDSLIFVDFMGALDPATGEATAMFNAEGLLKPEMEGWALSFAYALTFPWNFVSNPLIIDIGV